MPKIFIELFLIKSVLLRLKIPSFKCVQFFKVLGFNYTLPRLFVMFTLHFMYTIVLYTFHAYVPIHVHIGTGGAEWSHLVETIALPHLDLPKAGSGAPPICRPTPQL